LTRLDDVFLKVSKAFARSLSESDGHGFFNQSEATIIFCRYPVSIVGQRGQLFVKILINSSSDLPVISVKAVKSGVPEVIASTTLLIQASRCSGDAAILQNLVAMMSTCFSSIKLQN
jgi:hypothetical protein